MEKKQALEKKHVAWRRWLWWWRGRLPT